MRILIVTSHFAGPDRHPWLLDDLADELAATGNDVDVLVADSKYGRRKGLVDSSTSRLRAFSVGPSRSVRGRVGKALHLAQAWWGVRTAGSRLVRSDYDLVLTTSIGLLSWGLPGRLRRAHRSRTFTFLMWDFFPAHQLEIGHIRQRWLGGALRQVEFASFRDADTVAVMTPAGVDYFRTMHPKSRAEVAIIPPWSTSGAQEPSSTRWNDPVLRVIFGGQLVAGRNLEALIEAGRLIAQEDSSARIEIAVYGDGPDREELIERAAGIPIVSFPGALPREGYRAVLRESHLGVAITDPRVSAPTFPSKMMEYAGLGVVILACLEDASDATHLVLSAGAGYAASPDDPQQIATAILRARAELSDGSLGTRAAKSHELWRNEFDVRVAALRIVATADRSATSL